MAIEVRLPKFGDTMDEGTVVDCRVKPGDRVKRGDILFDIETDKATIEFESPADGFVKRIIAEPGRNFRVGAPLLILGGKDERISDDFVRALGDAGHAPVESSQSKSQPAGPAVITPPETPKLTQTMLAELKLGRTLPVTRLQKLTARKMLRSKQEIPCFYLNVKADVTDLVAYRNRLNQTSPVKVSYNDFIIKAVAMGLEKFPMMTGQLEADGIKLARSIGVGLAIDVPAGLVAPIVQDPDKKTVVEIARYSRILAEKARNDRLAPEDIEAGCITVSNLGDFGIDSFIPIVVPGQCSIIGIGKINDSCVPQDGSIAVRKLMNMTLSVDHKVTNGAYAAQFLDFVKKILEEPASFS